MSRKKMAPVHPGEVLQHEFLEPFKLSQNRVARDIGVPSARAAGAIQLTLKLPRAGAGAGAASTAIMKAGRLTVSIPSVTEITMPLEPSSPFFGVPYKRPVLSSKLAHAGWVLMLKLKLSPLSGSEAVGWKL